MANNRVVGYFDDWVTVQDIENKYKGYTDLMFSFWVNKSVAGAAEAVTTDNGKIIELVKSKGIKCILAAGGSTFTPDISTPGGNTAAEYGKALADFATKYKFDGVNLDIENVSMSNDAINWLIKVTQAVKKASPDLQISHAPQAPYFLPDGGYSEVEKGTNNAIDYYNIQYYNQGTWSYQAYSNYNSIFDTTYNGQPNSTSILSITASGVPSEKLVIGKPISKNDTGGGGTGTGYIPLDTLCTILEQAQTNDVPFGGVMGWKVDSDVQGTWGEKISQTLNS